MRGVCQQIIDLLQRPPFGTRTHVRFVPLLYPGCNNTYFNAAASLLPPMECPPLTGRDPRQFCGQNKAAWVLRDQHWTRMPSQLMERAKRENAAAYKCQLRAEDSLDCRYIDFGQNGEDKKGSFWMFDLVSNANRFEARNARLLTIDGLNECHGNTEPEVANILRRLKLFAPDINSNEEEMLLSKHPRNARCLPKVSAAQKVLPN